MDRQALLGTNSGSLDILNKSLSQVFPQGLYQQQLPASQKLIDVLKQRNPDEDPLFTPERRAANVALIKSIGEHNARAKLFGLASAFCALNAIKDITAIPIWGFLPQFPLTNLIPPSHLMPLQPCYQQCYMNGCCMGDCDGEPCVTLCDGPWVCTPDAPDPVLNKLGGASIASFGFNVAGALGSGALALHHWRQEGKAEKSLSTLLSKLEDVTQGMPNPQSATTPSANPLSEFFDKQLAQGLADADQEEFNRKRQEFIDLMKTAGTSSSQYKLCMLLCALFGLNTAKEVALAHFWGRDTIYPLTPLIEHNKSTPLTPCKQVCWTAGCCNLITCPVTETCKAVCEPQCVDEARVVNSFGYTSIGTIAANFMGLVTAGLLSVRYSHKSSNIKKELERRFEELDRLITSAETDIK